MKKQFLLLVLLWLVSKETAVWRRWESETPKFGIKRVDDRGSNFQSRDKQADVSSDEALRLSEYSTSSKFQLCQNNAKLMLHLALYPTATNFIRNKHSESG